VVVSPAAHLRKHCKPILVAADGLTIDEAGPNPEVVHGLYDQGEPVGPVIAASGDEPDAHGIAARHQPVAVVLDLMNPVRPGRRAIGR
jgi:CheY-like chemotaxis protein